LANAREELQAYKATSTAFTLTQGARSRQRNSFSHSAG
jgi:hypothetical protein